MAHTYIICVASGRFDDYRTHNIFACVSRDDAEQLAKVLKEQLQQFCKGYHLARDVYISDLTNKNAGATYYAYHKMGKLAGPAFDPPEPYISEYEVFIEAIQQFTPAIKR